MVDYTWNRGAMLVDLAWYRETFGDHQVDFFDLYLKEGRRPRGGAWHGWRRWGQNAVLFVVTRQTMLDEIVQSGCAASIAWPTPRSASSAWWPCWA